MSDLRTTAGTGDENAESLVHGNEQGRAVSSQPEARAIGRRQGDRVVAASESARRSLDQASQGARGNASILVVGPSGTGRKHYGRAIHSWSSRSAGPLVQLPISSTPVGLHERDLFGPSDASSPLAEDPDGALARAAQGSLLISGIDRMERGVRSALVQALKTGSFQRPSQAASVPATARIIATADSEDEKWLGDLPIQIVNIDSLSERREDVLALAAKFLAEFSAEEGVKPIGFTSDARNWLVEEEWPGNVRELRERIRQAVGLSVDGVVSAEALMLATEGDEVPSFKQAKRAFETRYVEGLLRRCGGNISRAARLAKKDRKDFYDVIRRTGVDPSDFRL
jgi:two-component system response regulator GlrR